MGAANEFFKRFEKLVRSWKANKQQRIHIVKNGENLSVIAARYSVPLPALIIWNRLDPTRPIHPGDRLIIAPDSKISDRK